MSSIIPISPLLNELPIIDFREIKELQENLKTLSRSNYEKLKNSILKNGFYTPVFLWKDGDDYYCADGHQRLAVLKKEGFLLVRTGKKKFKKFCDGKPTEFKEAEGYSIPYIEIAASDKAAAVSRLLEITSQYGRVTKKGLMELMENYTVRSSGINFDSVSNIDRLFNKYKYRPTGGVSIRNEIFTSLGDLYEFKEGGRVHRLLCGDSKNPADFKKVMQDEKADMTWADAPFNIPLKSLGSDSNNSVRLTQKGFQEAMGEMSDEQYIVFLTTCIRLIHDNSRADSIAYYKIDWRHVKDILTVCDGIYDELKNICVWDCISPAQGSFYRNQHELICIFKNGTGSHINNVKETNLNRSNVWHYSRLNSFNQPDRYLTRLHLTVTPVEMIRDLILDCSHAGDLILDAFSGSGTSLVACMQSRRQARLIDISPQYCDLHVHRFITHCTMHDVKGSVYLNDVKMSDDDLKKYIYDFDKNRE